MANTVISPNMQMAVPVPSTAPGPDWAQNLYACLYANVDQHNHSPGQGVQIQPSGINISSSLAFNNNSAISLKTTTFQDQGSALGSGTLGAVYIAGGNLFFNAGADGFAVQITNGHSVNGSAGTISGLPSGTASASFAASTFVFQSATSTAANIDGASILIRDTTANSNAITLSAPSALAANYSLTLPAALPGATSFVTMDASGNVAAGGIPTAQGITRSNQASVGQQISSSSGNFSSSSGSLVNVTNLSVTITTSGRPVLVFLQSNGATNGSISANATSATTTAATYAILRAGSIISQSSIAMSGASGNLFITGAPGQVMYLDLPSAGTYAYTIQASGGSGTTVSVNNCVLVAYEL